ncbi:hypothetical protein Tco_0552975 [Tanacetum coccineum]
MYSRKVGFVIVSVTTSSIESSELAQLETKSIRRIQLTEYAVLTAWMEYAVLAMKGPSTPPSDSLRPSRNAECSNCKLLLGKIKVLEVTMEMYMHPEQHTLNSTALLHEVCNDMGKLGLE